MTFYEKELQRIKAVVYSNQSQIDTVIGIRNYLDTNFENNINLEILSRQRFVSKFHLIRLFKKYYGLTPRQYLIDKRIEQSKEHLKKGLSVTQTCYAVGFTSLGSFSTLFKEKTGKAPAHFQKEQLSRSNLATDF